MYTIPVIYGAAGARRRSSHSSRPPPQAQNKNNSIREAVFWLSGGKVRQAPTRAKRDFPSERLFFGLPGEKSGRGKLARKRNGALIQNNIFPQFINALTPFSSHSPFINTAAVSQSTQTPSFRVQKQQAFSRRYFHPAFLHSLLPYLYAAIKPQTYLRGFSHTSLFP